MSNRVVKYWMKYNEMGGKSLKSKFIDKGMVYMETEKQRKILDNFSGNISTVKRSLRVKTILAVMVSLLISSPISSRIYSYVRELFDVNYGVLINTTVTLLVATTVITLFIHFIVIKPLNKVVLAAESVAKGDLTVAVNYQSQDEIGQLAYAFNEMTSNLRELVEKTNQTTNQVAAYSNKLKSGAEQSSQAINQISLSIQEVVEGTESQAYSASELSQSAQEISNSMELSAQSINSVSNLANMVSQKAELGIKAVTETVEQMDSVQASVIETSLVIDSLGNKSSEIGNIVNIITQISEQTNLLALNAAIEAARAGENGKGFAVVADEVRKLAEQSGKSASGIQELISEIQLETEKAIQTMNAGKDIVSEGIEKVRETGISFNNITEDIIEVSQQTQAVVNTVKQTNDESQEMTKLIENIAQITVQTSGSTQQVAASVQEQSASMEEITNFSVMLNKLAQELQVSIDKFNINK